MISLRRISEIGAGVSGVSLIIGGWLYMDSHFASAAELEKIANTLELSQILMRVDILEDRIDREIDKGAEIMNARKIERMENQIRRLEVRGEALLNKESY